MYHIMLYKLKDVIPLRHTPGSLLVVKNHIELKNTRVCWGFCHLRDMFLHCNADFQKSTHFVGASATFGKHTISIKGTLSSRNNFFFFKSRWPSTHSPYTIHPPPIHQPPFKNHLNLSSTAPPFNFSWAHLPLNLQRNNKILYFVFEYCDQIFFKSPWTVTWEFQAFSWFSPEIPKKTPRSASPVSAQGGNRWHTHLFQAMPDLYDQHCREQYKSETK